MRHQVEAVAAAADVELTRLMQAGVEASGRWWQGRREAKTRAPHSYVGRLLAAMCGEGGGQRPALLPSGQSFGPRMLIRKRNGAGRQNLIPSDYLCFNLLLPLTYNTLR
jgi:hypothetical protein